MVFVIRFFGKKPGNKFPPKKKMVAAAIFVKKGGYFSLKIREIKYIIYVGDRCLPYLGSIQLLLYVRSSRGVFMKREAGVLVK